MTRPPVRCLRPSWALLGAHDPISELLIKRAIRAQFARSMLPGFKVANRNEANRSAPDLPRLPTELFDRIWEERSDGRVEPLAGGGARRLPGRTRRVQRPDRRDHPVTHGEVDAISSRRGKGDARSRLAPGEACPCRGPGKKEKPEHLHRSSTDTFTPFGALSRLFGRARKKNLFFLTSRWLWCSNGAFDETGGVTDREDTSLTPLHLSLHLSKKE